MQIAYVEILKKEIELIDTEWSKTDERQRKVYLHNLWKECEIKLSKEE
jgi:hypothetical protein